MQKITVNMKLRQEFWNLVKELSIAEDRSFSKMMDVLIGEALKKRKLL